MFDCGQNLAILFMVAFLLVSYEANPRILSTWRSKSKTSYRAAGDDALKIETRNGWVKGRKIHDGMYGWNGIPYAKPPVGPLRFEPPQAPDEWTGILDATYDRSECIQSTPYNPSTFLKPTGSEDCLYINVYTPKLPQKGAKLLPVMVWIHGGGFLWGNSSYTSYGPDALVSNGVIVVSLNYRLGIFGFLSTGDKAAPGNNGLRDQLLALQWVQDNIKAFGGNSRAVTVFGESAGGASISYLVLSRRQGLFQKAIMESGTALCLWSLSTMARKAAIAVADDFEINTEDTQQLVSGLKQIDAAKLYVAANLFMIPTFLDIGFNEGLIFAPVREPESDDAVITGSNYNKLKTGNFSRISQIIGHNSAEAAGVEDVVKLVQGLVNLPNLSPAKLVPDSMNAREDQKSQIAEEIKAEYDFTTVGSINYLSDNLFVRPVQKTVHFTSKYVRTYFYEFSYTNEPDELGAAHADELNYLFNSQFNSSTDNFVRKCMTSCWTNFAKTGNPTPKTANICGGTKWKPLQPNDRHSLQYLNINKTVSNGENPKKDKMDFWRGLFIKYGNPPYNTY